MAIQNFIFLLLTLLFNITVSAQKINKTELDSLFSFHEKHNTIMGSMAISKNGKMLYTKAIGYSLYTEVEKIHATEKTKYRIGSISKTFTSAILFQLIEEGLISLSTGMADFFPEFPNSELITIGNLMNHRSGIRNFIKIKDKEMERSHEEMLKFISRKKLKSVPGTKTLYSNANYLILGYIIEKLSNESYGEILRKRITSKIGLSDTYYAQKGIFNDNESFPYSFKSTWIQQPVTDLSIPGASGGIISTPSDLTRFIEALYCGKIIRQSSLDKMKTITDDYGMGISEFEFHSKKAFGQVGGIDNFQSVVAYFPDDSLSIAFCSNGRVGKVKNFVLDVLNLYFEKVYESPEFKLVATTQKPRGLMKYVGVYSNPAYPLKIIISKHEQTLVARSVGESPCELKAIGMNKFKCDSIGVVIAFNKKKNAFKLKKGNADYDFLKNY